MKRILAAVLWVPLACGVTGMALRGSNGTPQPAMVLTATPTADHRYRVILKDGTQYTTREPYRVQGRAAVFVLSPGQRVVSVPLESVDQQATQAANMQRPTPSVTPTVPQRRRGPLLGELASRITLVGTPRITLVGTPPAPSSRGNDEESSGFLTFTGRGHDVSNLFTLGSGLHVFRLRHSGDRNFIVHLLNEAGRNIGTLANEIGDFSGSKAVRLEQAGQYLLNIDADGEWSVSVARPDSHSTTQAAPPRVAPSDESDLKVLSIDAKVTETNDSWSRFSWMLIVKNYATETITFDASIEFLDRSGFVLDEHKVYNARVPAGQQETFTGYELINAQKVGQVANVAVKLKPKRR